MIGRGGQPPRFAMNCHDAFSVVLVVPSGIEPASDAYQAPALPLSYGTINGASTRLRSGGLRHVTTVLFPLSYGRDILFNSFMS